MYSSPVPPGRPRPDRSGRAAHSARRWTVPLAPVRPRAQSGAVTATTGVVETAGRPGVPPAATIAPAAAAAPAASTAPATPVTPAPAAPAATEGPGVLPGLGPSAAALAGFVAASFRAGGGGVLATGTRLPAGGNGPPPGSAACALPVTTLRAGLASASLRAPAKSRAFAGAACELVAVDALVDETSLLRCA